MRRADQLHKTMTALRRCVEQCRLEADPYKALEHMLVDLRCDPDLTAADLVEIERNARRALAACGTPGRKAC